MPSAAPNPKHHARQLLAAGRLPEAKALFEQLCAERPDPEAWDALGQIHASQGDLTAAERCFRQALGMDERYVPGHCNLGVVLQDKGDLPGATACYEAALRLKPGEPTFCYNLGSVLAAQGETARARALYEKSLALDPAQHEARLGLGALLEREGRLSEARVCYEHLLHQYPALAEAHFNLGNVLLAQEKPAEAIGCYQEAIRLQPRRTGAHNNLARAQIALGRLRDAEASYRQALQLNPRHAGAHNNLGNVLSALGRHDEAIGCFQEALRLKPDYAEAYNNLGNTYHDNALLAQAIECFRQATALKPDFAEALNNLGRALRAQGKLNDGLEAFRQALRAKPDYAVAHSNLLFSLNYDDSQTPEAIFAEHRRWGEVHGHPPAALPPPANPPDPERRLRVGYVTPDLRGHSVGYFIEPILRHHDRTRFDVYCYVEIPEPRYDATTERLKKLCAGWVNTCGLSDRALAVRMRQDGIDILVDLAGHTRDNRLLAFAYRPAPVQISYLGYVNTTGLPAMDYRLTDAWADPAGSEALYTERLARLPQAFFCYAPPQASPAVTEPPVLSTGHMTFGSFNNLDKITPRVIALWARLLQALPSARLLFMSPPLKDPETCKRLYQAFDAHNIEAERLILRPSASFEDYLEAHNTVDIALDSFPHAGHTVTCHALWMGVPVITLAGDRYAGRLGVSVLGNLGLSELIAQSEADYVDKAVRLAGDIDRLTALRAGLRARFQESGLCDGADFTRGLEEIYRELWGRVGTG